MKLQWKYDAHQSRHDIEEMQGKKKKFECFGHCTYDANATSLLQITFYLSRSNNMYDFDSSK